MATFLTTHEFFCGLFGKPKLMSTDHAPSLVKAKKSHDWAEISKKVGSQGTEWRLTAKGCSWHNGLTERVIRSARHSLSHALVAGEMLDFHHFGAVLATVSAIVNARPLSVRLTPEGEFHSLSPHDILFGRAGRSVDRVSQDLTFIMDQEEDEALGYMEERQARIVREWRRRWLEQIFPEMVSRPKWKSTFRNLRVGDVGHVHYTKKVGEDAWRIAMVVAAREDEDGVVRIVDVTFRPRHITDSGRPYLPKQPDMMTICIQRFSVLLAVEEQVQSGVASPAPPLSSKMTLN